MALTTLSLPAVLAALGLITVELARSLPAWLRVRRVKSADGLSLASAGILAGSGLGWITVAALASSVGALIATSLWLILHLALCREIARVSLKAVKPMVHYFFLATSVFGLASILGLLLGELELFLGLTVALATAAYSMPALVAGMTSESTAGLSLVALTANSIEGLLYLLAGAGLGGLVEEGQVVSAYVLFGSIALASNVPRLLRTVLRRVQGLP